MDLLTAIVCLAAISAFYEGIKLVVEMLKNKEPTDESQSKQDKSN